MYTLPHTISTLTGEQLTFLEIIDTPEGKKLLVENETKPKAGPPMHVHHLQEETTTVISGRMGYQVQGQPVQYANPGDTVSFKPGVVHTFWNDGDDLLRCTGFITPPDNIVYFLTEVYRSYNENNGRPGLFDIAFLMHRYRSEFEMKEIPPFVQNVLFPIARLVGKITGKYKRFQNAPAAM